MAGITALVWGVIIGSNFLLGHMIAQNHCQGFEVGDVNNPACARLDKLQLYLVILEFLPYLLRYVFLGFILLCLVYALVVALQSSDRRIPGSKP